MGLVGNIIHFPAVKELAGRSAFGEVRTGVEVAHLMVHRLELLADYSLITAYSPQI